MKPPRLGIALILSGPSGAGKSTVTELIRRRNPEICFSISCTTREPRKGEADGKDYYFIDQKEFQRRVKNNEFVEHAEVHGNFYGTLKSEIIERVRAGRDVILDIDIQGAFQIREQARQYSLLAKCTEFVFLGPPSFDELERRLRGRGTDKEDVIKKRLETAKSELDHWRDYDYLFINKEVEQTVKDLESLIDILHKSTKRLEDSGFYT